MNVKKIVGKRAQGQPNETLAPMNTHHRGPSDSEGVCYEETQPGAVRNGSVARMGSNEFDMFINGRYLALLVT